MNIGETIFPSRTYLVYTRRLTVCRRGNGTGWSWQQLCLSQTCKVTALIIPRHIVTAASLPTHSASLHKYIQCKHTSTEAHTVQAVQDMFYTFHTLPWSHIVWPAPAQAVFSSCFSLVHCFSRLLWAELFTRFTLCSTFHCTVPGFSLRLVGGDVPVLELQLHFGCTSITMGRTGTVHKA